MYASVVSPKIRVVAHGEVIPKGWVRRSHPVWSEFVRHANWWPNQIHQLNGQEDGMVYLWIPKADNLAYERGRRRTRFCVTYQGQICNHITPERHKSCHGIVRRVIVAPKC